jgi:hypothetical protein
MIKTPYHFEADLSDQEFQKIGQFACRWALIEHTIGNCLRVMLGMNPKHATIMIFPLSLDHRMTRIRELLARQPTLLNDYQRSVLEELRPLIKAMQSGNGHTEWLTLAEDFAGSAAKAVYS